MAFREVTMQEIKEVVRQWLGGGAKKAIARRVGVDRNTARRYIEVAERLGLRQSEGPDSLTDERLAALLEALKATPEPSHGEAWLRCAEHRGFIEAKLKQRLRLTKVRKLLERQGVVVPYATLHRFAASELGFGRKAPTIPVDDCKPGEEVQLDTGWVGQLEPGQDGKRRRFRAWIFTSVYSRCRFVYPCFQETTVEAIAACEAAWRFFGGVFKVLIPDNTKAIVQKADSLDALINTAFLEYAQSRDFVIDPARARRPKDKARVERAVQSVRDDGFAGEKLRSIEEAREHARSWCLREWGMRRHTRTQRLPLEHFNADEKCALKPAPVDEYDVPLWCDPKVHPDQHAEVQRALYSLPRRFRGKKLRARADRTTVRFYFQKKLVKTHPRKPPGGRSTDPTDFPPEQAACATRDVAFLEGQAAQHGEQVGLYARALLEGPLPWTRMRRVYALLGLCRRYGSERVAQMCRVALAAGMLEVHRLRRMLEQGPVITEGAPALSKPSVPPACRYLRPPEQYALPFARHEQPSASSDEGQGGEG